MKFADYDTETTLVRPARTAPELVCFQCIDGDSPAPELLGPASAIIRFEGWLSQPETTIVGHALSYDNAVMAAAAPELLPAIFAAYEANRMQCTWVRENLIACALGRHRGEHVDGVWKPSTYELSTLAWRYARIQLDKPAKDSADGGTDHWRLRYGTLRDTPIDQWPAGAKQYALEDAVATRAVREGQQQLADSMPEGVNLLADQHRQAYADFCLRLVAVWGLRSDEPAVKLLEGNLEQARDELAKGLDGVPDTGLILTGMVRPDLSRDMKVIMHKVAEAYLSEGRSIPRTDSWNGGVESAKPGRLKKDGTRGPDQPERKRDEFECVSTGAEVLGAIDVPDLEALATFQQLGAMLSKDVPMLLAGIDLPIHTRFRIAATGRSTSSGPNIQNFGKEGGVRECIVARPGHLILQLDMPGLELHTFSECATAWLGASKMGELLNNGVDVHAHVGATFAQQKYEAFLAAYKAGEKNAKRFRNVAKPFNFGRLGGMGEERFTEYARKKPYFVRLEPGEFKVRNEQWLMAIPEAREWYRYAKARFAGQPEGFRATVQHLYSQRYRGDCGYTDSCNSPFQGLGADITKAVTCQIVRACYTDKSSPLFGARCINYIHDEWLLEVPEDGYEHERAEALIDIVLETANQWLQFVPFRRAKFDPALMRRWDKSATTKRDEAGRLIVWEA